MTNYEKKLFKGFRQVDSNVYASAVTDNATEGYLWFVRTDGDPDEGDIYFGDVHYGHYGNESSLISNLESAIGDIKEAGFVDADDNAISVADALAQLKADLDEKVDKEEGKGLSTNDYTDNEKEKLEGVEEGAQVNIIEAIKVNGVEVSADDNKTVDITIEDQKVYTIKKEDTAEDGFFATYKLCVDGVADTNSASINIPKDFLVKSAEIKVVSESDVAEAVEAREAVLYTADEALAENNAHRVADENGVEVDGDGYVTTYEEGWTEVSEGDVKSEAVEGVEAGKFAGNSDFSAGDKYIDFVINTKDDDSEESHIYLPVNALVDTYVGDNVYVTVGNDNTITLTDNAKEVIDGLLGSNYANLKSISPYMHYGQEEGEAEGKNELVIDAGDAKIDIKANKKVSIEALGADKNVEIHSEGGNINLVATGETGEVNIETAEVNFVSNPGTSQEIEFQSVYNEYVLATEEELADDSITKYEPVLSAKGKLKGYSASESGTYVKVPSEPDGARFVYTAENELGVKSTSISASVKSIIELVNKAETEGLGKTYTEGDGIDISDDDVISAEVKEASSETVISTKTTNKNFLTVDTDGLEVKGVDADATVLSEDIQVVGTDIANNYGSVFGDTIPAGTPIQDILLKLLCKELWATSIATGSTFSVIQGAVTPNIGTARTVEVGTKYTLPAMTIGGTSASQSVTAKTFTYGYAFKIDENEFEYVNSTSYTQTLTPTRVTEDADRRLLVKFTGCSATNVGYSADTTEEIELTFTEGTNQVALFQTGYTYSAKTTVDPQTLYVATNLKNYYKQNDNSVDNTLEIPATIPATGKTGTSNKTSAIVTGAYKYYYGIIEKSNSADYSQSVTTKANITDGTIGNLTSGWTNGSTQIAISSIKSTASKQALVIVIPSTYEVTYCENTMGIPYEDATAAWPKHAEVEYTVEDTTTTYNVYVLHSMDATEIKNIKINKKN